jgi:hypothetical protein
LAGESVLSLVGETSVLELTLHRRKHQVLIEVVKSVESAQLLAANKRITVVGKELQLVKGASELFDAKWAAPEEFSGCCLRTSKARPFNLVCHTSIWSEPCDLLILNSTQTSY